MFAYIFNSISFQFLTSTAAITPEVSTVFCMWHTSEIYLNMFLYVAVFSSACLQVEEDKSKELIAEAVNKRVLQQVYEITFALWLLLKRIICLAEFFLFFRLRSQSHMSNISERRYTLPALLESLILKNEIFFRKGLKNEIIVKQAFGH